MDKDYVYQLSVREWIENELGKELMIPVFGSKKDNKWDIYIQSCLLPIDMIDEELKNDTYNARSLSPGITVYGSWEDDEKVYHRWNNDKGIEPFVISRSFEGLAEDSIEIVEEFRLLFNLYYNSQKKEFIDLTDGESVTVVKIKENGYVTVNKKYMKTFLALKNMSLLIHIDSRCVNIESDYKFPQESFSYKNEENTLFYTVNLGNCNTGTKQENYSFIYAKKAIMGCALRDCNIWPYNEEKNYIDFIIGMDDNGNEIKHTCNPQKLSNYFGANPDAPHYLTPVFFDAAVLNKYYAKPEIYKIEDGIIRCGGLWSLYIDNHNPGYVSVYLGDLGRDLPSEQEQYYWRGFNKNIDVTLSDAKFKRDFLAMAADSDAPDFIFKRTYTRVNSLFMTKLGWQLFLDLDEQDIYNFETIRIPINNSISEMDLLVLSLVKILLDSLNEKEIVNQLTGKYEKLVGSISKIETWFKEKGLDDYQEHIKYLRNLQELRSSGTGHRKGKGYQKISRILDVQKENYAETFSGLLKNAVSFLEYLEKNIDRLV